MRGAFPGSENASMVIGGRLAPSRDQSADFASSVTVRVPPRSTPARWILAFGTTRGVTRPAPESPPSQAATAAHSIPAKRNDIIHPSPRYLEYLLEWAMEGRPSFDLGGAHQRAVSIPSSRW